ncbi:MAG TPA: type II toxin-antitoxin system VapC family toxin [Acidiferrobacterales bacterium]|nr:type II toxin-antitoxin system VapC family toxin [Acidiferrobacterales bacterium]
MIALDTNVLARYLLNDDQAQAAEAERFLETAQSFYVSATVWLELAWVLESYDCSAGEISKAFRHVMGLPNLHTNEPIALLRALAWFEQGMDFADALHLALAAPAESFATFDRDLAKKAGKLGAHPVVRRLGVM